MKIGILQAGSAPDELIPKFGNYSDMSKNLLQPHGNFEFEVFPIFAGEFPTSRNQISGWLITGSKYSAYEPLPWIEKLEALIREIVNAKQPLAGICFGHQIIAQALGGKVEKSDKGWGLGFDSYILNDSAPEALAKLSSVTLNIFHQDQVIKLPAGAERYATSRFCQNAGYRIGNHVLTIQAHPEFSTGYNLELITLRKPEDAGDAYKLAVQEINAGATLDSDSFGAAFAELFNRNND